MNVTKTAKTKKDSAQERGKDNEISYTLKFFGKNLVTLRKEAGYTQEESAKLIGITRNSLSQYENWERTPNIEVAVNAANAYNVSLDYLFGTGYKNKEKNNYNLFEMGFSEDSLSFLEKEENRNILDSILSSSYIELICECMKGLRYKPLVNSYEVSHISRLISDMLYRLLVHVTKDSYKLRPMLESEIEELDEAVRLCLNYIGRKETYERTGWDDFLDPEDSIELELERVKNMLDYADYHEYDTVVRDSKEKGFSEAIKLICNGDMMPMNISIEALETWLAFKKDHERPETQEELRKEVEVWEKEKRDKLKEASKKPPSN